MRNRQEPLEFRSKIRLHREDWLSISALTFVTRTFCAPHWSHISLIVGTGGLSPGFATIRFQQFKQTHFSVFTIIISSGPAPFGGRAFLHKFSS